MVYSSKTLLKWMIWGSTIFGNTHMFSLHVCFFQQRLAEGFPSAAGLSPNCHEICNDGPLICSKISLFVTTESHEK